MIILDLAKETGLNPVRDSATNGGEYKSACPKCGGDDRFRIWPNQNSTGRYWCRQCQASGDSIQFCRDFMGLKFSEALAKVGADNYFDFNKKSYSLPKEFSPKFIIEPSPLWNESAKAFVESSHLFLLKNPHLLNVDKNRGLSIQSIISFQLGWNNSLKFVMKDSWGIEIKQSENVQKLCLPKGIVIPSFRDQKLIRVKIRRDEWIKDDKFPKYHIITGGTGSPSVFGTLSKPIVLIEAELDAMLVQQLAGDLCTTIALGGVSNRADKSLHQSLQKAPIILYALDFDDAGKKQYMFWRSTYSNLRAWPVPKGKSPGDAFNLGVNLRNWISKGIEFYSKSS